MIYGQDIPQTGLPDWFKFIGLLNPSTAFMHAARTVIPEYGVITFYPVGSAFYLQDWVGFLILGAWGAIPLLVCYHRFGRADRPESESAVPFATELRDGSRRVRDHDQWPGSGLTETYLEGARREDVGRSRPNPTVASDPRHPLRETSGRVIRVITRE
jgi:hypothetical protein